MEMVSPPKVGVEINLIPTLIPTPAPGVEINLIPTLIPTPAGAGAGRVLLVVLNAVDETPPMLEDMTLAGTDSRNACKAYAM